MAFFFWQAASVLIPKRNGSFEAEVDSKKAKKLPKIA